MTKRRKPSGREPNEELSVERRRRFLATLAGAAGSLAILPAAFGKAFLADPPKAAKPCDEQVIGSSTCTTVVTTPSYSTRYTTPSTATGTGTTGVVTTTTASGTTTANSTIVTMDGGQPVTTPTVITQTWRQTVSVTNTNASYTGNGTVATLHHTCPSGSATITITKSWYYTRPCLVALPVAPGGRMIVEAELAPDVTIPKEFCLQGGPSHLRKFGPIIALGV